MEKSQSVISLDSSMKEARSEPYRRQQKYTHSRHNPSVDATRISSLTNSPVLSSVSSEINHPGLFSGTNVTVPVLRVNSESPKLTPYSSKRSSPPATMIAEPYTSGVQDFSSDIAQVDEKENTLNDLKQLHNTSIQTQSLTSYLEKRISQFKDNLSHDIIIRLDSSENDIDNQIQDFETTLNELKTLQWKSKEMIDQFATDSEKSNIELQAQVSRFREIQLNEFSTLEGLETRMQNAKQRVEEFRQRLTMIDEHLVAQEQGKKRKRLWIKYVKRGTVGTILIVLLATMVFRHYQSNRTWPTSTIIEESTYSPVPTDLDGLLMCLDDFDNCPD